MPRFSVIMQSYLGDYPGSAKDKDKKIVRAIDSVINQTLKDWELIVIADGCEKTFDIVTHKYEGNAQINCLFIPKQPFWSGTARDIGKFEGKGDYIIYLDIDDYYGKKHLETIDDQFGNWDWVYYNDLVWNGKWMERICNIRRIGQHGTSNICFKRSMQVDWSIYIGYAHDHYVIANLVKKYNNFTKIATPGYYVCHLPPHNGGKGYDI